MALQFKGSLEELRQAIQSLDRQGDWLDLGESKQFRDKSGGILNWFPTTGTIQFQGRAEGRSQLETLVQAALTKSIGRTSGAVADNVPASASVVQTTVHEPPTPGIAAAASLPILSNPASICDEQYLGQRFQDSELVIGLVGAVGTGLRPYPKMPFI